MASQVATLFEKFGIQTPEEIRKQRERDLLATMNQGNRMNSYTAQNTRDFENIGRAFGWKPESEKKAESFSGLVQDAIKMGYDPQDPEYQAIEAKMLELGPEYGYAFDQMRRDSEDQVRARKLEELKLAKAGIAYQPVQIEVPDRNEFGEVIGTKLQTIQVQHRLDADSGKWVPIEGAAMQPAQAAPAPAQPPAGELPAARIPNAGQPWYEADAGNGQTVGQKLFGGLLENEAPVAGPQQTTTTPAPSGNPYGLPAEAMDAWYNATQAQPQESSLFKDAKEEIGRGLNTKSYRYGNRSYTAEQLKRMLPDVYARYVENGTITE